MEGFLLIDKPVGLTSHDVIDRLRKITGMRKIGHAGTLDPFASGLLFIAIGRYTKKLQAYVGLDKTYETMLHLGATTETYDSEGDVLVSMKNQPEDLEESRIEEVLDTFRGGYLQKAPLFSAKKINGKKLYELARKGVRDDSLRPTKQVTISRLSLKSFAWPHLSLVISCGSGTYIRSLASDVGEALGTGAYTESLRRTQIGTFLIQNAVTLAGLTKENVEKALLLDSPTND